MKTRIKRACSKQDINLIERTTTLTEQIYGLACPNCESRKYSKNGKDKGNQRYICTQCGKRFRSTTGATIHHLHLKSKVQAYMECMNKGLSLRKTAKKCNISLQTAFRWRHRFLNTMQKQAPQRLHKNRSLSAIVIPFSNKGKPKTVTIKPNITSILQIDTMGRATIDVIGEFGINTYKLKQKTSPHTTHIASKSIPKTLKSQPSKGPSKEQILQAKEITMEVHLWLAKFRGVSTKYLTNYWKWFTYNRQIQLQISRDMLYMYNCL